MTSATRPDDRDCVTAASLPVRRQDTGERTARGPPARRTRPPSSGRGQDAVPHRTATTTPSRYADRCPWPAPAAKPAAMSMSAPICSPGPRGPSCESDTPVWSSTFSTVCSGVVLVHRAAPCPVGHQVQGGRAPRYSRPGRARLSLRRKRRSAMRALAASGPDRPRASSGARRRQAAASTARSRGLIPPQTP